MKTMKGECSAPKAFHRAGHASAFIAPAHECTTEEQQQRTSRHNRMWRDNSRRGFI